jgi:hypothetical protein
MCIAQTTPEAGYFNNLPPRIYSKRSRYKLTITELNGLILGYLLTPTEITWLRYKVKGVNASPILGILDFNLPQHG